jgi:Biopolymer transport protein
MNFTARRRSPLNVDVTPLIDIIFQLVLFFMVSTTFVSAPGIQVDLPRSSSQTILRDKQEIKVWITKKGSVFVDEQPVSWQELSDDFARRAAKDPSTLVIIKADKEVEHGRVVAIMDLARTQGLNRLAIATEVNGGGGSGAAAPSGGASGSGRRGDTDEQ